MKKGIEVERIKQYADWFFKNHAEPHFKAEEDYIFPILGMEHELVTKAMKEHQRLARLFKDTEDIQRSLSLLEEELEKHIRFEERILFNEIQDSATKEQLDAVNKLHHEQPFIENTDDEFWK
jgi:iron-sulfur cluster repair protein YtfE (RIC family)